MCKIICVTNRKLCREDFLLRIERIAAARPYGIILREKDLPESEFRTLAYSVKSICTKYDTQLIINTFTASAKELECPVHLPLSLFDRTSGDELPDIYGASCHSVSDALKAKALGCSYIIAGHIFDTDCKKGLPGRGLQFLTDVCQSAAVPVYAIGGITEKNAADVITAGASGVCLMSSLMTCSDPSGYLERIGEKIANEIR